MCAELIDQINLLEDYWLVSPSSPAKYHIESILTLDRFERERSKGYGKDLKVIRPVLGKWTSLLGQVQCNYDDAFDLVTWLYAFSLYPTQKGLRWAAKKLSFLIYMNLSIDLKSKGYSL